MGKTVSMNEDKFEFGTEFQETLLQYTVSDRNGYKALNLYKDQYFTLLEHQVIAKTLKLFYERKKQLPADKIILREFLRQLYLTKDFQGALTASDKKLIHRVVTKIYSGPVKGGDDIFDEAVKFARYIDLKHTLEHINLTDYAQYENFATKIRKSITIGNEFKKERGTFLFGDLKRRQFNRQLTDGVSPTPFWQLNRLTNGGGYDKGSVIVIMGPEKRFKTGMLVNVSKAYLKRRKKVLYIDLENGQESLATRVEQSIMRKTKRDILSGKYDNEIQKKFRKFKRLGSEMDIKRMPAYSTTCNNIQNYVDEQYNEYGIRYDVILIDYVVLLGSISGKKDDVDRISDAYVDLKNLVAFNKFETCWTAHHITREGKKRTATCYHSNDAAKCIDVTRHVDAIIGINQNDGEREAGIVRLEIVEQRDGVRDGRAYFWLDIPTQSAIEFNKHEVDDYVKTMGDSYDETQKVKGSNDLQSTD